MNEYYLPQTIFGAFGVYFGILYGPRKATLGHDFVDSWVYHEQFVTTPTRDRILKDNFNWRWWREITGPTPGPRCHILTR